MAAQRFNQTGTGRISNPELIFNPPANTAVASAWNDIPTKRRSTV